MHFSRQFSGVARAAAFTFLSVLAVACGDDDPAGVEVTGSVSGTVTLEDGTAVPGTGVALLREGFVTQGTSSSTDGSFSFDEIATGTWSMTISPPTGFVLADGQSGSVSVNVVADQDTEVDVELAEDEGTGGGGDVVEIDATNSLTFSPATTTIAAGTTVRWTNTSGLEHTVTPDGHNEWVDAALPNNGSTFSHTFNTPGTYAYFCRPHENQNMNGVITVE